MSKQDQKIIFFENDIFFSGLETPGNIKSIASCTKKVDNVASKKNEKPFPTLASLPTSCEGLRREGHFTDGVYLMRKENTNKISAALCKFQGANQGKIEKK